MIAMFFLAVGILFFWLAFKDISSREILARGWGFSSRIYHRDSEPVMYWVSFLSYLVCAVWATVFGVLMVLK